MRRMGVFGGAVRARVTRGRWADRGESDFLGTLPHVLFNAVAVASAKAKGLLLIIVLAHTIGVVGLGVWTQVYVLTHLLSMVAGLGLFNALVRFYPAESRVRQRKLLWTSLYLVTGLGLAIGLVAFTMAPWTAQILTDNREYATTFRLGAALVPLVVLRLLLLNIARAENRLSLFSGAAILSEVLELALVVAVVSTTRSTAGAIAGSAIALGMTSVILFLLNLRAFGKPLIPTSPTRYLRYSLPLVPMQLSDEALARADRLIVGAFLGPAAAGVYAAIYSLASITNITNAPLTNVLFPKVVRLGHRSSTVILRRAAVFYVLLATVQAGVLAALAGPLATFLLHEPQPWLRSSAVLALAGAGVICFGLGRILSLRLFLVNRTVAVLGIWGSAAVCNLLLNLLFVPIYGLVGAALSTVLAYGIFLALQLRFHESQRLADHAQMEASVLAAVPTKPPATAS